jgi:hypothetical protein
MARRVSPEEAAVRGDKRAVVFEGEREINRIPQRHLIVESQIQCAFK